MSKQIITTVGQFRASAGLLMRIAKAVPMGNIKAMFHAAQLGNAINEQLGPEAAHQKTFNALVEKHGAKPDESGERLTFDSPEQGKAFEEDYRALAAEPLTIKCAPLTLADLDAIQDVLNDAEKFTTPDIAQILYAINPDNE